MSDAQQLSYRPTPEARSKAPFHVFSVSYFKKIIRQKFSGCKRKSFHLYWGIEGEGTIFLNHKALSLGPNQVIITYPKSHVGYRVDKECSYCSISLDGPLISTIALSFGLGEGLYNASEPPIEIFKQLKDVIQNPSKSNELKCSELAYKILSYTSEHIQEKNSEALIERAISIIHKNWSQTSFNLNKLSDTLGTHASNLSKMFKKSEGITPIEYLTNCRIQNAVALLRNSDNPIMEIAKASGYDDPNYFSRLIKQQYGMTPTEIRENLV